MSVNVYLFMQLKFTFNGTLTITEVTQYQVSGITIYEFHIPNKLKKLTHMHTDDKGS